MGLRYDELRSVLHKHFSALLQQRKANIAAVGPIPQSDIAVLESSARVAQQAIDQGTPITLIGDDETLLAKFAGMNGFNLERSSPLYGRFREDFAAAYRDYCRAAVEYNLSMARFDFSPAPPAASSVLEAAQNDIAPRVTLQQVGDRFLAEGEIGEKWTHKTKGEREDHLKLLYEMLGQDTEARTITQHHARSVKDQLMKLPTNRNKRKATRALSLEEAIGRADGKVITATTVNKYLQTYSGLFHWAKRNSYATDNVFLGLSIAKGKRAGKDRERKAFNDAQMGLILNELVTNKNGLIGDKKAWHRWGPLIAAFTGARLNEIAQLELADIVAKDGIDYFDINDEGDFKSIKASASKRRVPIHSKLIELGFMGYVESKRREQAVRLFPEFSYCRKNGWGRSLGHWFNQVFLIKLSIKTPQLVFHSFRHSAVEKLNRKGAAETLIKCVIGHEQAGVTQQVYGKGGFTLKQLQDTVELLDYPIDS